MPRRFKKKLTSTIEDRIFIKDVCEFISSKLKHQNLKKITFLGSTARDTYCNKPKQFDYFLAYETQMFDFELFLKEVQENYKDVKCDIVPKNRGFPYVTITLFYQIRNISIDLVPCLTEPTFEGPIDRTILHHEYVCKHINEELRLEIKRLKYLLKRKGLYGACSEIKGLSGYCCEVLILKYKKIENIDSNIKTLADPCDLSRNLLASLSKRTLQRFHLLLKFNFKVYNDVDYPTEIYMCKNAPLKLYTYVLKNPYVVSAIRVNSTIILELKDLFVYTKECHVENKLQYFSIEKNKQFYTFEDYYVKKYSKNEFLKLHPDFVKTDSLSLLRSYNFFK